MRTHYLKNPCRVATTSIEALLPPFVDRARGMDSPTSDESRSLLNQTVSVCLYSENNTHRQPDKVGGKQSQTGSSGSPVGE